MKYQLIDKTFIFAGDFNSPEHDAVDVSIITGNATLDEGASAPALTTVGGDALLYEGASVPALTTVGGDAYLYEGASAPALKHKSVGRAAALKGTPLENLNH